MQLTVLNYEGSEDPVKVRTTIIDGQVWFVGKDVADALGYQNSKKAIDDHCNPKGVTKRDTPTSGGLQTLTFINEGNIYRLVAKSKLKAAQAFEEWVFETVIPEIRRTGSYGRTGMTVFAKRVMLNYLRPAPGYFSVINELYLLLQARFEMAGYVLKDIAADGKEIRPDISVGRLFSEYLKTHHAAVATDYKWYDHEFINNTESPARQYHDSLLSIFRRYVLTEWLPNHAERYLLERDRDAIPFLPAVLGSENVLTGSAIRTVKQ